MTVSINIDKKTKEKALHKARKDKLSFSAIVRILVSEYADGNIIIGARPITRYEVSEVEVDPATQKKMDEIMAKWDKTKK